MTTKRNLFLLIVLVVLFFILGVNYETDYRLLTRKTVSYFANYQLRFYGGKDFRFFNTEIAFILTLIPIGFYFTTLKFKSKHTAKMILIYLIFIPLIYCVSCYLESQYIMMNSTVHSFDKEVLIYHQNNVNYKTIALLTVLLTYLTGLIFKRFIKLSKIKTNKNDQF